LEISIASGPQNRQSAVTTTIQEARKQGQLREAEQRQRRWQQQLKGLVFPYELVAGAEAEAAYEAARLKGQTEGYTPLVITPDSWLLPSLSLDQFMMEARRIIDAAPPAQEFFAERTAGWTSYDDDGRRKR
jgi:hypothetical protein